MRNMKPYFVLFVFQLSLVPLITRSVELLFDPVSVSDLYIGNKKNVTVSLSNLTFTESNWNCTSVLSSEPDSPKILGTVLYCSSKVCDKYESSEQCNMTLELEGLSLGTAKVFISAKTNDTDPNKWRIPSPHLDVSVLRPPKVIHKVFNGLVATIVSLNYINMGCALDLKIVKAVIKKPIGPIVGMFCQFLIMPAVAYGVGLWILSDPVQQLGLLTFGSSPGGGASNMWTVLLRGNLNLSITMTFFSTIISAGTIPLWLFTVGKTIIRGTSITIPFENIALSLVAMVVPVAIGLLIQRYLPKVAATGRRILAPVCIIMIIIIIILGSIAYWELLLMLTWRIVIAASLNVWIGFLAGCLVSVAFRFPKEDVISVAVETGIQNTGIAYILLNYSLTPPANELASVVPVAASIITPLPLFIIYCFQKIKDICCASQDYQVQPLMKSQRFSNERIKGIDNLALESEAVKEK